MKILFVVKNLRVSNGVASFLMNYYRELVKIKDINFDFLIVSNTESPYYEEIKKNNGKIYIMPSIKKPLKMISFLKKVFKNNKYDILHSNVFNSNVLIAYFAKKYGVPIRILHSHATTNGDTFFKKIRNIPFQLLSIKYSNYYFACSNMAGNNIFKNSNFYVINNAIELKKYSYSKINREKIRKENTINSDTKIIGIVARITHQKNPYFILKITKELKNMDCNFIVWWFGNGDMDKEITKKSKEMEISEKIKFWGPVNDVYNYYSAMDYFILPSFYEGLPVVGIEAQVSGVKCFFSDTITKEVALTNYSEFLSIDNECEWAKKISKCDYNREEILNNINSDNYDIKLLSKKLYNIYKELLKENNIRS